MRSKSANIVTIAVVFGVLAAAWVLHHVRQLETQIAEARGGASATVDIVITNDAIPIGSRIEAENLRLVRWPMEVLPEGAFHDVDLAVGTIARTTIERNQPVLQSQLVAQGSGLLPLMITEGMRAVSVKVDNVTGVSGFITPNSRVDVLVSGTTGTQEPRSKVILQNVKVLATGTSIEQRDQKPVEVPTVTLLVSPEDAEKVALATHDEPVRLALRNYRDEEIVKTPGVSASGLYSRAPEPPAAKPSAPPARASVEVLLGEKLTRQIL